MKNNFGRLSITGKLFKKGKHIFCPCECKCGNRVVVQKANLTSGHTKSCGCLRKALVTKHGQYKTPEYYIWRSMKSRCLNKNDKGYKNYGGRGITIEPVWVKSFMAFIQDVGKRPSKTLSLDRLNNDAGYIRGNVAWRTKTEQCNNMRKNLKIPYNGKTMTLAQWADKYSINRETLRERFKKYGDIKTALNLPLLKKPHMLTYKSLTLSIAEWSIRTGIPHHIIYARITKRNRWSAKRALTTPVNKPKQLLAKQFAYHR